MVKKKSYNPFKMWGSYVGAVGLWMSLNISNSWFNFWYTTVWQQGFGLPSFSGSAIVLTLLFGFLIGWGIHSAVRSSK